MANMVVSSVAGRLRRKLTRWLLRLGLLVGAAAGAYASAQIVAKGLTRGDEDSDDFGLLTIMTGKELAISAAPLSYGRVMTLLGQTRVDLRDATLDPSGAHLDLVTTLSRVEVVVPAGWAVEVEQISSGVRSGLAVEVSDPAGLPEEAPKLSILADTRWGCGWIRASAAVDVS